MKKSPAQIVANSLKNLSHYSATIETVSTVLLNLPEVKSNDSLRTTLESTVRMAVENRDSEIRKIFSRVSEKVGTNPDAIRTFALSIFPELTEDKPKQAK